MSGNKILFLITKATWGGAQRYVYDLATHLPRDTFEPLVAFGEGGRLQKMLADSAIPTHHIPALGRNVALFSDIASFFQIFACLRRVRPAIMHLNSSKAAALGALAARMTRVPHIVFTVHGWPFNERRNLLARTLIYLISWFTALLSHTVIVVSRSDEAQGKRMWRIGHKLSYIPIGIDPPHFLGREEALQFLSERIPALKNVGNEPRVVTIAELTLNKGLAYAIDAIATLKERGVKVTYVLIGDGEERAHLKSLTRARDVEDRVFFAGFVAEAAQYLKVADVFLLPSIKEGMPYVLLEAAAADLPVITTTAVNPDVVAAYENIRAVPPADANSIAESLVEVMRERSEDTLFSSPVHFSLSNMITQTAELYSAQK